MSQFNAIYGQSIWDVILNTYGSFDNSVKMIKDNSLSSINIVPSTQQPFIWDSNLNADVAINDNNIFATSPVANGNVLSVVQGSSSAAGNNTNYVQPSNPNYNTMIKYEQSIEVQYVAGGGETNVTISDLIGNRIVQITREIKPMLVADFGFNANTGTITFNNGISLNNGETLFIIYAKVLTS